MSRRDGIQSANNLESVNTSVSLLKLLREISFLLPYEIAILAMILNLTDKTYIHPIKIETVG